MIVALSAYLVRATDVSGVVLFGVWPIALLARLLFRPQPGNGAVMAVLGWIAARRRALRGAVAVYHIAMDPCWMGERHRSRGGGPYPARLFSGDQLRRPRGAIGPADSEGGGRCVNRERALLGRPRDARHGQRRSRPPKPFSVAGDGHRPTAGDLRLLRPGVGSLSDSAVPVFSASTLACVRPLAGAIGVGVELEHATASALLLGAIGLIYHAGQPTSRRSRAVLRGERHPPPTPARLPQCSLEVDGIKPAVTGSWWT